VFSYLEAFAGVLVVLGTAACIVQLLGGTLYNELGHGSTLLPEKHQAET